MKKIFSLLIITVFHSVLINSQNSNYWVNAKPGTIKIFTISFLDEQNGKAISNAGDVLFSNDGGTSWNLDTNTHQQNEENIEQYIWKADIYCSAMQTTDSGLTWHPYEKEKQEHFCGVYLKDNNTGYNVAEESLNKVTAKIFLCLKSDEVSILVNNPQQCTEYYRSASEGWALGWCVKDFKVLNK